MFEKGQKVYRVLQYYNGNGNIQEWTFIRKETEKNGGGWILYDEDNKYRTMFNIDDFTDDKEQVELHLFQNRLESINNRRREWQEDIRRCTEEIEDAKKEIKLCDTEESNLVKKFGHLTEKYPEEFI
jgi:hypothetical protein